jgi:hypothetical protein
MRFTNVYLGSTIRARNEELERWVRKEELERWV